ncbi:MAG: hypothetical protein BMS9Abin04_108 [Planctomycetia bacterium]|nr:MAG: hypothetical protein BMS9Abin04_108 [Planctomycetia bacterium]
MKQCSLPKERPWQWIAMSTWCCTALVQVALAAAPEPPVEAGLSYRRIYAPDNRMADWPTGGQRYLPVDAQELDRLLELGRRRETGAPAPDRPVITRARYQARLDGDVLVDGQAWLDIVQRGNDETVMLLEPCSLAVGMPCWNADPAQPAIVGRWPSGRFGVLVRQSGTLHFRWSLRARHDTEGDRLFRLRLPMALSRQLELRLPADAVPSVDHGLVVRGSAAESGHATWYIQLEPQPLIELRLRPASASARTGLTLVRSQATYDVSVRGIEVEAQFALELDHGPRDSVSLALDPALQVVAVRWGDDDVSWSISADGTAAANRVLVPCDPAVHAARRLLWVKALAPLAADRLFRLPRVRLEGAFWESGQVRILVEDPLLLNRLELVGCRHVHSEPMPAPRTGASIELEEDAPDASVEVVFARRSADVSSRSGPPVGLGPQRARQQAAEPEDAEAADFEPESVEPEDAAAAGNAVNGFSAKNSRSSDRSRIRENSDITANGPNSDEFGYQNRSRRWAAGRGGPDPGNGRTGITDSSSAAVDSAGVPSAALRTGIDGRARQAAAAGPARRAGGPASAWAWRETIRSEIGADGRSLHTLAYRIENAGRDDVHWLLPAGAEVKAIWRDGQLLPVAACLGDDRQLAVGLAPDRPYTVVVLQLASTQGRLGMFGSLRLTVPAVDFPILTRAWSVWLPSAYEPASGDRRDTAPTWARRLFGPLAFGWRNRGQRLPSAAVAVAVADARRVSPQTPAVEGRLHEVAAAPGGGPWFHLNGSDPTGRTAVFGVVHRRCVQVLALAAFLAAAIVVSTWCRFRPTLLTVLLVAGAVLALAIPAALAPVATGAWLGELAGWACLECRGGR